MAKPGRYKHFAPVIEYLYIRGVRAPRIAELLGLNKQVLTQRLYDWGTTVDRDFREKDLLEEAREKFADLFAGGPHAG